VYIAYVKMVSIPFCHVGKAIRTLFNSCIHNEMENRIE
jgi:hypothetical protein